MESYILFFYFTVWTACFGRLATTIESWVPGSKKWLLILWAAVLTPLLLLPLRVLPRPLRTRSMIIRIRLILSLLRLRDHLLFWIRAALWFLEQQREVVGSIRLMEDDIAAIQYDYLRLTRVVPILQAIRDDFLVLVGIIGRLVPALSHLHEQDESHSRALTALGEAMTMFGLAAQEMTVLVTDTHRELEAFCREFWDWSTDDAQ